MKLNIIITFVFLSLNYNVKAQESQSIDYKNMIIGKWNFSHTEPENNNTVGEDIRIANIAFFADGSFTINGNDKTKIVGKFKIDSSLITLSNAFVNGEKSEMKYQFPYIFSDSKKLILEFISELGKRKLIFAKK